MKRVWGHVLAGLTVLGGGVSMTAACVHDDSTIFVFDVLAPQEVSNGQTCSFNSDTTQPFLSSGIADVDFVDEYGAFFLVGNQMVPRGNPSTPTVETSYVQIQGAVVRITDSGGNQLANYTYLTSATIPPLNGTTPSFSPIGGPTGVTIIDHDTMASQAVQSVVLGGGIARLVTYTRFFGTTTGGTNVESGEFEFPVDVCRGCLIAFAPVDINPEFEPPNCGNAVTGAGGTTALPVPCFPGRDIEIDCSQCQSIPDCRPPLVPRAGVVLDAGAG